MCIRDSVWTITSTTWTDNDFSHAHDILQFKQQNNCLRTPTHEHTRLHGYITRQASLLMLHNRLSFTMCNNLYFAAAQIIISNICRLTQVSQASLHILRSLNFAMCADISFFPTRQNCRGEWRAFCPEQPTERSGQTSSSYQPAQTELGISQSVLAVSSLLARADGYAAQEQADRYSKGKKVDHSQN